MIVKDFLIMKNLIKFNYDEDFDKIQFVSNNNLPIGKLIYVPSITVTIRCVIKQGDFFYPHVYLDDALYQVQMISYEKIVGYNNKTEGAKSMVCNHYYFKDNFDYQPYVCNDCHDFSVTVMDLSDFIFLNIKGSDHRVYISNIDKKESMIIFKKSNLDDKGVL